MIRRRSVAGEIGGVHDDIGELAQRPQNRLLGTDHIDHPASGASGCLRRVSLNRSTRVRSSASEKMTVGSNPSASRSLEHADELVEVLAPAHV